MPIFRFNLEDHRFIADRGRHDCIDEKDAHDLADEIADRLVQDDPSLLTGGHAVVVRDTANRQVYRAEMDRASIMRRRSY